MGRGDDSDYDSDEESSPRRKPELRAWRGLAHYRTHMKRMALNRNRETRTTSDLYLLEDIVNDVRFICDLPMSLRLNICKVLGYEIHGPGHRVAKQGSKAFYFTIIFTGSVKCTYHQLGVQEDKTWIIPANKWFGDKVLEDWNYQWMVLTGVSFLLARMLDVLQTTVKSISQNTSSPLKTQCIFREDYHKKHGIFGCREYTIETNEKTELLTLTRRDYERVLDIKETPDLRDRISFLKGIERFKSVPRQSLLRLANVLSYRVYSKNRIITFQGDDSVEMYFIRSGECRIILEVPNEKLFTPLPRASSFLKQYWPTQYHRCKMDDNDKQKDWWHPSFEKPRASTSKPGSKPTPRSSRCDSVYNDQLPKGLGAAILRNPDAVFSLVKRRKSKRKSVAASVKRCQSEITPVTDPPARRRSTSSTQPRRRSSTTKAVGIRSMKRATTLERIPIGGMGEIRTNEVLDEDRPSEWGSPRGSIEAMTKSGTLNLKDKLTPPFPTEKEDVMHWPFVGGVPLTSQPATRFSLMQVQFSDVYGEKRAKKNKYSLRLFLHDCHRKEQEAKAAEFGEKEHRLWQMGLHGDQKIPGIIGEGNAYYKEKFEKWARYIIDREKKFLSNTEIEDTSEMSFMPGITTSGIMKLKKGRGKDGRSQYNPLGHSKTSSILDIGCLKAGEYFGEKGLMTTSKRAASIVSVSMVETLVLTKWDFHRHCDRQVLKVFKSMEYKKKKEMFRNYKRTQKWERYKRTVLNDVFAAKARRFNVGPRKIRVLPKCNRTKHELPIKEWFFKSHPTALPSFSN